MKENNKTILLVNERATQTYWNLESLRKYSDNGVARSVPPERTIAEVKSKLGFAGITKISEVTFLDRIGIPNFMAVRPKDRGPGISYYNGKGTTKADAYAGAIMEAFERHGGEHCNYESVLSTRHTLRRWANCIDPTDLTPPFLTTYSDDIMLEWVEGYDLLNERAVYVPLNCVVCPYEARRNATVLFHSSTNGLASGNSLTEALCHAILELVERDVTALAMAESQILPTVKSLLHVDACDLPRPLYRQIRFDGLPRRAKRLVKKIQQSGLQVFLRDFSHVSGIAVIDCTISDDNSDGCVKAYGGCGAHLDARVALLRAITEAAQSRLGMIQGGREDLPEIMPSSQRFDAATVFGRGTEVEFSSIPSVYNEWIDDDIRRLLSIMRQNGFRELVAFDMTHPSTDVPVVRVVAPQAETWTAYHLHTGRGAFGYRAMSLLNELAS
jgi:YcaO-like protein with predicted kinase domain